MKRRDFITKMLGLGTLLSLPPLTFLSIEQKRKFEWIKNSLSIPLYECYVRGMWYYQGKNYTHKIYKHDALDLVRQPGNTYDKYAIEIYWSGIKMGYLPKYENVVLANLIDNGMLLKSVVNGVYPDNDLQERIKINVQLLVPDTKGFSKWVKSRKNNNSSGMVNI